jgi:hypothetical protein
MSQKEEIVSEALTPARIMEVGMAFWPAKTLLSAVELGLFTTLGANAMTGAELERALGLHGRANPDFFDTLVALRFLDRDGDGADARYRNTAETARFLDRCSPHYIGGFLEMANALSSAMRSSVSVAPALAANMSRSVPIAMEARCI